MLGKDSRPFTIYGHQGFEGSATYDIVVATGDERASKRKLEALKRVEEHERLRVYSPYSYQNEVRSKKKSKWGKKGPRKFTKPLAWKSPWPDQDPAEFSDMDTDWNDIK